MKKRFFVVLLALVLTLPLASCGCDHEWYAATCTAPKTCSLCDATEGEALPHTWQDATCTTPKTCSVCKTTDGEAAGHNWQDATCTIPKTCSVCNETEGSKLKTDSRFTTASTKHLQGTWVCDVVMTDEMMGLQNFGNADVRLNLKFGNTGKLTQTITLKDEKKFMAKMKQHTIDSLYDSFAQEGLSKEQSDQAMLKSYGLNVNDYVEASLKNYDINAIFKVFNFEEVYYVKDGAIYTALSWKANFEKSDYTLKDGKLKIDGLSLEEGGAPLVWTKK